MIKLTVTLDDKTFQPFKDFMVINMLSADQQMQALVPALKNISKLTSEDIEKLTDYKQKLEIQMKLMEDIYLQLPETYSNIILPNGKGLSAELPKGNSGQ